MVGLAVQRIPRNHRTQSRTRRPLVALYVIIVCNPVVALGQNFLHIAQVLLRLVRQRIVGIFLQKSLILVFRGPRLRAITVRLLHLPVMRIRHLQLRVRGFRHEREEHDEIFVRLNCLRGVGCPALFEIRVPDPQLGLRQILAVGIRVDQRLQV